VAIYRKWCVATKAYVEKDGGRDEIRDELAETMRSHYDRLDRIADDVERLGFEVAAEILRIQLPQTAKGRSGGLGEILATELVEEEIGLRVPVRRLRYKDGRNMAVPRPLKHRMGLSVSIFRTIRQPRTRLNPSHTYCGVFRNTLLMFATAASILWISRRIDEDSRISAHPDGERLVHPPLTRSAGVSSFPVALEGLGAASLGVGTPVRRASCAVCGCRILRFTSASTPLSALQESGILTTLGAGDGRAPTERERQDCHHRVPETLAA
jgi:hypothetical protein